MSIQTGSFSQKITNSDSQYKIYNERYDYYLPLGANSPGHAFPDVITPRFYDVVETHLKIIGIQRDLQIVPGEKFFDLVRKKLTNSSAHPSVQRVESMLPLLYPEEGIVKYFFRGSSERIKNPINSLFKYDSHAKPR